MRGLIAPPVVVAVLAVIGFVSCKALGVDPNTREFLIASGVVMAATVLAVVPMVLTRNARQYAVSQAALVGTVVHLMTAIGGGGMVYLNQKPAGPFLYWLSGLYWASLIAVVIASVQAVKSAEPEPPMKPAEPAKPAQSAKPALKD